MTIPDLTTTEGVLHWAAKSVDCDHGDYNLDMGKYDCWDTKTAAYIAECVRLRHAFEAIMSRPWDMHNDLQLCELRKSMLGKDSE